MNPSWSNLKVVNEPSGTIIKPQEDVEMSISVQNSFVFDLYHEDSSYIEHNKRMIVCHRIAFIMSSFLVGLLVFPWVVISSFFGSFFVACGYGSQSLSWVARKCMPLIYVMWIPQLLMVTFITIFVSHPLISTIKNNVYFSYRLHS